MLIEIREPQAAVVPPRALTKINSSNQRFWTLKYLHPGTIAPLVFDSRTGLLASEDGRHVASEHGRHAQAGGLGKVQSAAFEVEAGGRVFGEQG